MHWSAPTGSRPGPPISSASASGSSATSSGSTGWAAAEARRKHSSQRRSSGGPALAGRRGGGGGHAHPPPHIQREEQSAGHLAEPARGDQPADPGKSRERDEQLGPGAHGGGGRHDPVHGLGQLGPVARVVPGGAREHPGGHAHDHHQHEAHEKQVGMGRDDQPRWIALEDELVHDDPGTQQETRHQKDEAGLDVASDERRHPQSASPSARARRALMSTTRSRAPSSASRPSLSQRLTMRIAVSTRSARRRSVAARRASTGSTDKDLTESCAWRSRRPIISASSLTSDGWRSVSALTASAGTLSTTVGSVVCAAAG